MERSELVRGGRNEDYEERYDDDGYAA